MVSLTGPDRFLDRCLVERQRGKSVARAVCHCAIRFSYGDQVEIVELVNRFAVDEFDLMRGITVDAAEVIGLAEGPAFGCEYAAEKAIEPIEEPHALQRRQLD